MLRSYAAQIRGNQIIWHNAPRLPLEGRQVVVVLEDESANDSLPPDASDQALEAKYQLADLTGRLQWQGDALASQRASRDNW